MADLKDRQPSRRWNGRLGAAPPAASAKRALGCARRSSQHVHDGPGGSRLLDDGLVLDGRRAVLLLMKKSSSDRLPTNRVVVERRDLVEAQLLVVVRAHPLGGVDRALSRAG